MKVHWQPEDIRPGRVVGKVGRTERYMIGYQVVTLCADRYTLNSLADGMVRGAFDAKQLAVYLNAAEELPAELLP